MDIVHILSLSRFVFSTQILFIQFANPDYDDHLNLILGTLTFAHVSNLKYFKTAAI